MTQDRNTGKRRYLAIGLIAIITLITIAASVLLIINSAKISELAPHSYAGLFFISILAGAPLPIASPGIVLNVVLGSILNPVWIGLIGGAGNAVGNTLTYAAGRGGFKLFSYAGNTNFEKEAESSRFSRLIKKLKWHRLLNFAKQKGAAVVLVLSLIPNPLLTPLVLSLGAARYKYWKFLIACWAGQTIQAMILAYIGHLGLRSLLGLFGIVTKL